MCVLTETPFIFYILSLPTNPLHSHSYICDYMIHFLFKVCISFNQVTIRRNLIKQNQRLCHLCTSKHIINYISCLVTSTKPYKKDVLNLFQTETLNYKGACEKEGKLFPRLYKSLFITFTCPMNLMMRTRINKLF